MASGKNHDRSIYFATPVVGILIGYYINPVLGLVAAYCHKPPLYRIREIYVANIEEIWKLGEFGER